MKRTWIALFAVGVSALLGCVQQPRPLQPYPSADRAHNLVTMDHYHAIKAGMTLDEVNRIVGFAGEEQYRSDTTIGNISYTLTTYVWKNSDHSALIGIFKDGILNTKSHASLK